MILFISLLCTLVSAINANQPALADLGLHHNSQMKEGSRLILNPFSIFGNPPCEYNGNKGTCYGEVECLALAGNYGNFCPGLQGLCCLFYRSCGQRTSQEISYFRNVQYPLDDRAPDDCSFRIVKRSDEYCGIRVTMEKADLPARYGDTCDEAFFQVTGIHNDRIKPKCGRLTGKQYTYSMINVGELYIHMRSPRSTSISWNIRVNQVQCSDWEGENYEDEEFGTSGGDSGAGSGGGSGTGSGGGSGGDSGAGSGGGSGGDSGAGSGGGSGGGSGTGSGGGSGTGSGGGSGTGSGGGSGGDSGTGSGGSFGGNKPVFPPTLPPPIVGPPAPPTTERPTTNWRPSTTERPTTNWRPSTTERPTTASPITGGSFSRCGVKGPSFGQAIRGQSIRRLYADGPMGPEPMESMARRRKTPNNRRRPVFLEDRINTKNDKRQGVRRPAGSGTVTGSIGSDAAVTTLDWGVPTLGNSLFAHYAGERSVLSTRITYGTVAGTREFPWNIAMTIRGKFHCGASLLSNTHVLTAAHCVVSYQNSPALIDLSIGDWDLSTSNDGRSLKVKASKVSVHPSYSRSTLQNDLAVLKLAQRVEYTDRIRPICLPSSNLRLEGELAIVSGWGRNEASKLQSQLHHLQATVIQNTECDSRWNKNGAARGFIVSSMMCMDSSNGDSCNGDSGGPSIYEYPVGSGNYVQVGIVSFGSGSCTDETLPGVYTRVSYYKTWIETQMN